MPPPTRLDRDVYQILRKLEDDHERNSSKPAKFTIAGVYDMIKKSNSSVAREKKRPLEDAIERAMRLRKKERAEDEDEMMEDTPAEPPTPKVIMAIQLFMYTAQRADLRHSHRQILL